MKKIIFTTIILLFASSLFAQYNDDSKVLGDKAFNNKDYYEAAFYYKKAATGLKLFNNTEVPFRADVKKPEKGKPVNRDYVSYQLAESYRGYENYLEAEGWYFKVIDGVNSAKYPLARLWYGVCQRANQHFDEAIKQLEQFLAAYQGDKKYKDIAEKELRNCHFAKEQYQYPALIEVVMMKNSFYSDGSDYSLIINNDNRLFTSSRTVKDDKKHLNRIYTIKSAESAKPEIIDVKSNDKNDLEYGTPSIDPAGKHLYFTQWHKEGSKTIHAIYFATLNNGTWDTPVKLNTNVNVEGFNSIQPFVTTDGKRLFYSSNKPGGQGGDDIWVSDLDANGTPLNSFNLGNTINTPMDEQAPCYFDSEKKLVYSSKGFTGLGGFDFYECYDKMGKWTIARNLGYPMNSAKDDLYFLKDNTDVKKSYISSDRSSDCCLNLFEIHDKRYIVSGLVTDCDSHTPLEGALVSFIDSLSKETLNQVVLAKNGLYYFKVDTKRPYNLKLEKKGYFTKIVSVPTQGSMSNDTLHSPELCLQPFMVNKPIVIKNVLYDYNKATLRPESKIVLDGVVKIMQDNQKFRIELGAHTDSIGGVNYNLKLSQARAQACVDYIVSKGIDENRIYAKGYGKSKPVAPNSLPNGKDNPEGRQINRRTEFTVIKSE